MKMQTGSAKEDSAFEQRTEEASSSQYFQFYGYLSQQQNMMQDYIRTATYQRAMLSNPSDFKDKIVLDVGAGSGILSFFAVQAGAKKVYAVEASSMALHCETLVRHNQFQDKIVVIAGKIEEISLPEQVDTIISEPMGYMLLNERMLESFLHAKKFLKPSGKMYPTRGDLHMAPFSDEALYNEQSSKANFWCQEFFYGVNLSVLREQALKEYFKQPVVDTFDIRICVAPTQTYTIDFANASEQDLHRIEIPLSFTLTQTALIHGVAFWFDVAFIGSNLTVWLSTAPTEPLTHWYQVRCLLQRPLLGRQDTVCTGKLLMVANKRQSYEVSVELSCDGQNAENQLDLKNPYFRYTGQLVQAPPGNQTTSPTETYWQTAAMQTGAVSGVVDPASTIPVAAAVNGVDGVLSGGQQLVMNGAAAMRVPELYQQPLALGNYYIPAQHPSHPQHTVVTHTPDIAHLLAPPSQKQLAAAQGKSGSNASVLSGVPLVAAQQQLPQQQLLQHHPQLLGGPALYAPSTHQSIFIGDYGVAGNVIVPGSTIERNT